MIRIDLPLVGYQDVPQVKKLGGRWDGDAKMWYVIDPVNSAPLLKWIDPRIYYKINRLDRLDQQAKNKKKSRK